MNGWITTYLTFPSVALGAAGYSLIRKLYTDGTLRLYRTRGHNQASAPEHTKPH